MCKWGTTKDVLVHVPAEDSATGEARWCYKAVDQCIVPLVDALNKAGILTRSSCCGHGGVGSILLQDGRELLIRDKGERIISHAVCELERWALYEDSSPNRQKK